MKAKCLLLKQCKPRLQILEMAQFIKITFKFFGRIISNLHLFFSIITPIVFHYIQSYIYSVDFCVLG